MYIHCMSEPESSQQQAFLLSTAGKNCVKSLLIFFHEKKNENPPKRKPTNKKAFPEVNNGDHFCANDPRNNALGGTTYFGATAEVQFPIFGLPRDLGMKGAVFADAGSVFGYDSKKTFATNSINLRDEHMIRSSVGASLIWTSPLGPIRFDFAKPLSKDTYDRTQFFRFSGGTTF